MGQEMMNAIVLKSGSYGAEDVAAIRLKPIWRLIDQIDEQLNELYEIDNPNDGSRDSEVLHKYKQKKIGSVEDIYGDWIYLSWSGLLIHSLPEEDYYRLRTNRNQLLITSSEQKRLHQSIIGVAGLSVGLSIVGSLVANGIGREYRLADFDILSTSNLNRVRATISDPGSSKLDLCSKQLLELDPYLDIKHFPKGISDENLSDFLIEEEKLTVVFDEIDDFEYKIRLRISAKQQEIPVLMITNLGDSVLLDVERYDNEPGLEIFNGLLGELPNEILNNPIGEAEKIRYAAQIVGIDAVPTRALESLSQIGKTLVGRPQLASTVAVGGGLAALAVRHLILGDLPSGRYRIDLAGSIGRPFDISESNRTVIIEELMLKKS